MKRCTRPGGHPKTGLAGPARDEYTSLVEATAAEVGRRAYAYAWTPVLTNFYPTYDGANDQVDRVTAVRRTRFQRVIPRYRLSTSETRDEGLGPSFIDMPSARVTERSGRHGRPYHRPAAAAADVSPAEAAAGAGGMPAVGSPAAYPLRGPQPTPAPLRPGTGLRVDVYA